MIVDPGTVRYITRKVFQDFGKQFLVDTKSDFQVLSHEVVYKGAGRYEARKIRRTKNQALDQYFRVLNDKINSVESTSQSIAV